MKQPMTPDEIAQAAECIYAERFREEFEQSHDGEFVVIDVTSESAHLGQDAEDALEKAQQEFPDGEFHIIKVGSPAAFRIGYIGQRSTGRHVARAL